jgi:hypothetical protein
MMFRARPPALALTSGGLVLAAIVGVQLGRSAISEINPIHFQGPLERPQAIEPQPDPAPFDPYSRSYVWSQPPPPLAACGADCDSVQFEQAAQFAMDRTVSRDPALPYWRDATPATQLRPWAAGEMPDAGLPIERYMRYPVNREQAERADAEAEQAEVRAQRPVATAAGAGAEALRPPPAIAGPVIEE